MAIVAPITSTIRGVKLEVVLPVGLKTSGSVLGYQLKSLDISKRQAQFVEKVPLSVIDH